MLEKTEAGYPHRRTQKSLGPGDLFKIPGPQERNIFKRSPPGPSAGPLWSPKTAPAGRLAALRLVKRVPLASSRCVCITTCRYRARVSRESPSKPRNEPNGAILAPRRLLPTFGARFGATLRSSDASEVLTRRFYTGTCRGLTVESGRELTTTQARTPTTPVAVLAPTATGRPVPVRQSF